MGASMDIRIKRAYEKPTRADGRRILVDRLWPRGISKSEAWIDKWMKSLAPSAELRKWFSHEADRWPEFRRRYSAELRQHDDEVRELARMADEGRVTLVFGARDTAHNNAEALRAYLERKHDKLTAGRGGKD